MKKLILLAILSLFLFTNLAISKTNNKNLIGSKAIDWQVGDWLNSQPMQLKDLQGKVVLVRWWTTICPFCKATAPALNEFYQKYKSQGLEVVGFYHHKSSEPLNKQEVYQYSKKLGFQFPIAIDYRWQTLTKWWLENTNENWTSVSFLIDRQGTICHIHPGGEYVKGDKDYKIMEEKIVELLKKK